MDFGAVREDVGGLLGDRDEGRGEMDDVVISLPLNIV